MQKNTETCRRKKLLESYNSVPSADLVKHLCCDVCDMQCDCNEENCKSFRTMYHIYKSELDIESSSESSMSSDNYNTDTSESLSESQVIKYIIMLKYLYSICTYFRSTTPYR